MCGVLVSDRRESEMKGGTLSLKKRSIVRLVSWGVANGLAAK